MKILSWHPHMTFFLLLLFSADYAITTDGLGFDSRMHLCIFFSSPHPKRMQIQHIRRRGERLSRHYAVLIIQVQRLTLPLSPRTIFARRTPTLRVRCGGVVAPPPPPL